MNFFNGSNHEHSFGTLPKQCDWQAFQAVIFNWSQQISSKIPLSELYGTNQIFPITANLNQHKKWIFENDVKKTMKIKLDTTAWYSSGFYNFSSDFW